jgi:hypothetical protein
MPTDTELFADSLDILAEIRHLLAPLLGVAPNAMPAHEMAERLAKPGALRDVLAEREKQRAKWGDAHDDEHGNGALALAAADVILDGRPGVPSWLLAGSPEWVVNLVRRHGERDRLVIAAALLLAEIERLDRAAGGR